MTWTDSEIGETFRLKGDREGTELAVTLEAVVDPAPVDATPYNAASPEPGQQLVEFKLQISNVGTTAFELDSQGDHVGLEAEAESDLETPYWETYDKRFYGLELQGETLDEIAVGETQTGSLMMSKFPNLSVTMFTFAIMGPDGLIGGRWSIP